MTSAEPSGSGIPSIIGFSVANMDTGIDPWKDFFLYSAGNWLKNNPVPSDKSRWGAFDELSDFNTGNLRNILEICAGMLPDPLGVVDPQLGDFYRSAMDVETLEHLKFKPVEQYIESIERIDSVNALVSYIHYLHLSGIFPLFQVYSQTDEKNSSIYALYLYQGGISLPDRDYYILDTFSEIRQHYLKHIEKVFRMYGFPEENARNAAGTVLSIETGIAKSSRSRTDLRDAEKNYNRMSLPDLDAKFQVFGFRQYLKKIGVPETDYLVVGQPEFFSYLNTLLTERPLEEIKIYVKWIVLNVALPYLFVEAEEEHFDMFNRKIRGQIKMEPRWKRSVHVIDQFMGEALGKIYVKEHFGPEARERMNALVKDLMEVFADRLASLSWMNEVTRERALEKFKRFRPKIGHPAKFRDYSSVEIRKDEYFGNVSRCAAFELRRETARVGRPVDKDEWFMTPPTVNAYFSPPDNEIVFPAGILQPPFFDVNADDAVNYGAIGAVIAHEMTHGYDDQGRRYDLEGNLKDWWSPDDERNFMQRASGIADLYSSLELLPGVHVNGKLTLGENIADFGGVSIAYEALQRHLERNRDLRKIIDGFTPEQRFFISWAQMWRQNVKEPEARMLLTIDPHSPNKFRAIVPAINHPGFVMAFGSQKGEKTNPIAKDIQIW
ncbi:MAG: M13 family metallopeptidase [Thermoplasmataceae archaeon]